MFYARADEELLNILIGEVEDADDEEGEVQQEGEVEEHEGDRKEE